MTGPAEQGGLPGPAAAPARAGPDGGEALRAILLAGPTGAGKSALALALAEALGGTVINADSQQVYDGWRILSARPSAEDMRGVPHRLYGHVPLEARYSVGQWLDDLAPVLAECRNAGRMAIVAGGTGLYFKALSEGLAEIPPVSDQTRARAAAELGRHGLAALAGALAARDPATARRIDLANPARVLRAWEVLEETGTPLAEWQDRAAPPLLPPDAVAGRLALLPERGALNAALDARFDAMIAAGALDEVRAVMARGLPASAPGMKAVGAPELMAHLRGETSLDAAVAAAKTATRRYAKRQATWIRNQMRDWDQALDPETGLARMLGPGGAA